MRVVGHTEATAGSEVKRCPTAEYSVPAFASSTQAAVRARAQRTARVGHTDSAPRSLRGREPRSTSLRGGCFLERSASHRSRLRDGIPARATPIGLKPTSQITRHASLDVLRVGHDLHGTWFLQCGEAGDHGLQLHPIVRGVAPRRPRVPSGLEPQRSRHAQPPGPGQPRQDPSVNSITRFTTHLRHLIREVADATSGTSASVRFFSPSSVSLPSEASRDHVAETLAGLVRRFPSRLKHPASRLRDAHRSCAGRDIAVLRAPPLPPREPARA